VIDDAVRGADAKIAGETVSSVQYLAALRGTCALILHAATESDLDDLPSIAASAFASHCERRMAKDAERMQLRRESRDGRTGPKIRSYSRVPEVPALMAAIAPLATDVLSADCDQALEEAFAPLVARARKRHPYYVQRLQRDFSLTGPVLRAFVECAHRARPSRLGVYG
jgi:hypothetical protein